MFRVDLGVMVIKGYTTLPIVSKLELYHRVQFSIIPMVILFLVEGVFLLCKKYGQHILSLTGRASRLLI